MVLNGLNGLQNEQPEFVNLTAKNAANNLQMNMMKLLHTNLGYSFQVSLSINEHKFENVVMNYIGLYLILLRITDSLVFRHIPHAPVFWILDHPGGLEEGRRLSGMVNEAFVKTTGNSVIPGASNCRQGQEQSQIAFT